MTKVEKIKEENIIKCQYCGINYHYGFVGGNICEECFKKYYFWCGFCEKILLLEKRSKTNSKYCQECFDDSFVCKCCDKRKRSSEKSGIFNGINICERCEQYYKSCNECGNPFMYDHADKGLEYNGKWVCRECLFKNHHFVKCRYCERIVSPEDLRERLDGILCRHCDHAFPRWNHHFTTKEDKNKSVYYGIEIEADDFPYKEREYYCNEEEEDEDEEDNPYIGEEEIIDHFHGYCEDRFDIKVGGDSSLNDGVELKFEPRTIKSWVEYKDKLKKIMDEIEYQGGSCDKGTCGLHIHRSRKDLSEVTLAKLITAFVRFQKLIEKYSGRRENGYCSYSWYHNYASGGGGNLFYKNYVKKGQKLHRYLAVNLAPPFTIEFRIFRGTDDPDRIMARIYFCDAIVKWCKYTSIIELQKHSRKKLWMMFINFIKKQDYAKDLMRDLGEGKLLEGEV